MQVAELQPFNWLLFLDEQTRYGLVPKQTAGDTMHCAYAPLLIGDIIINIYNISYVLLDILIFSEFKLLLYILR